SRFGHIIVPKLLRIVISVDLCSQGAQKAPSSPRTRYLSTLRLEAHVQWTRLLATLWSSRRHGRWGLPPLVASAPSEVQCALDRGPSSPDWPECWSAEFPLAS